MRRANCDLQLVVVDPPRSGLGEKSDQRTGEVEGSSHHLCFMRSGNSLARSGSPASIRIPGGGGASRGFISPDLPPGKRLPPVASTATWDSPGFRRASSDSCNHVELARLNSRGRLFPRESVTPNQLRSGGRQPLLWAALAFAAGIAVGVHAWRPPLWWVVAWIVFALSSAYLLRRRGRVGVHRRTRRHVFSGSAAGPGARAE